MYTCEHCREKLWEDLYGLLEPAESRAIHNHLVDCAVCQAERVKAQADQRAIAEVARLRVELPPFTMPAPEAEPESIPIIPRVGREAARRRIWPWLAGAAAALVLIGLPLSMSYWEGLNRRQAAYADAEKFVQDIVAQKDQLQRKTQDDWGKLLAVSASRSLRVQVSGPAVFWQDRTSEYKIAAVGLDGQPVKVQTTARITDENGSSLAEVKDLVGKGTFSVPLKPRAGVQPGKAVRLEIVAKGLESQVLLEERLPVGEQALLTRLVVDKPVYYPGDKIRFHSVTLQQFDLRPPQQELIATYRLQGPQGFSLPPISGALLQGGIGGGEVIVRDDFPEGIYALLMNAKDSHFRLATQELMVRHKRQADLTETGQDIAADGSSPRVEFFPEGGELIAGVPNRVYFRARDDRGQPIEIEGQILDMKNQVVATVQTQRLDEKLSLSRGLGVFSLTPEVGEKYSLRFTAQAGNQLVTRLPATNGTTSISILNPIMQEGEPLRVVLHSRASSQAATNGPDAPRLAIGVFCRGRLVACDSVSDAEADGIRKLPVNANGVLRVTLFEFNGSTLSPRAERLVYSKPAQRLDLSVTADKERYKPGDTVGLRVESRNEQKVPEPSWLLVSVVDQKALRAGGLRPDAQSHFHLASDLKRPEDLEDAQFLLSDDVSAAKALDLFLGTQGWRRLTVESPNAQQIRGNLLSKTWKDDSGLFIVMDNVNDAEREYRRATGLQLAGLNQKLTAELAQFDRPEQARLEEARLVAADLEAYQGQVLEYVRIGSGAVAFAILIIGSVLLLIGLQRLLRGRAVYRPYLAGAFVAILLCFISYTALPKQLANPNIEAQGERVAQLARALEKPRELNGIGNGADTIASTQPQANSRRDPLVQRHAVERVTDGQSGHVQIATGDAAGFVGSSRIFNMKESGPGSPGRVNHFLPVVQYSQMLRGQPGSRPTDTLLWWPALRLTPAGNAAYQFVLPGKAGSYRVRVEAHSPFGRLGAVEAELVAGSGDAKDNR